MDSPLDIVGFQIWGCEAEEGCSVAHVKKREIMARAPSFTSMWAFYACAACGGFDGRSHVAWLHEPLPILRPFTCIAFIWTSQDSPIIRTSINTQLPKDQNARLLSMAPTPGVPSPKLHTLRPHIPDHRALQFPTPIPAAHHHHIRHLSIHICGEPSKMACQHRLPRRCGSTTRQTCQRRRLRAEVV